MKIIKEFFNRKKIAEEVLKIIEEKLSDKVLNDIKNSKEKKANKVMEKSFSSLKFSLKNYKSQNQLGLYGTSKLLKVTQDRLLELGFEVEMVKEIVRKIML